MQTVPGRVPEATEADLADHVLVIHGAITNALKEFIRDHAKLRHRYTPRSEASIIHDLMVAHLRQEFDGVPGVGFRLKGQLFLVGIDGKYVIRAKKMDKRLLTKNILTQQVLDFLHQAQLVIPGTEGPTNLHVGYQPKSAELLASQIWMTCPNGGNVKWAWSLSDGAEVVATPVQVPLAPASPAAAPVASPERVKPRVPAAGDARHADKEAKARKVANDDAE